MLQSLTIEGYKSIRSLRDFKLTSLNVLIGPNGTGKSNFIDFFRFLDELIHQRLQLAVGLAGTADALLHLGPKETKQIAGKLCFTSNSYEFELAPTDDGRLVFAAEFIGQGGVANSEREALGSGHFETLSVRPVGFFGSGGFFGGPRSRVLGSGDSWVIYHFHDTSATAGARRPQAINDNLTLRFDASNLAPFLYRMMTQSPDQYAHLRDVVRLAAPFFDDFLLRPIPNSPEMIQLEWRQRNSDYPFRASQLSDGTLRFISLATALLQPNPPTTMLFDEPELGLHPYALGLLGGLFRQFSRAADDRQAIIATQSAQLLSEFEPEDVVIVERNDGQSTFRRLESSDLAEWLDDYSLGELWEKNVLGGRPASDRLPSTVR